MLADAIGTDLARLFGEIDKLKLLVGKDHRITPELIERNIGISKDYNNFELEDALIRRDGPKALTIAHYFERNPKEHPIAPKLSQLFNFFTAVLLLNTARVTDDTSLMQRVGTSSAYRLKKFKEAASFYNTRACVNVISYLRECDVKSKGNGSRQDQFSLFNELIYKILHA